MIGNPRDGISGHTISMFQALFKRFAILTIILWQSNTIMVIASYLLLIYTYMTCDDWSTNSANYDEFIKYLGMMHAIIQHCDIFSIYIIDAAL